MKLGLWQRRACRAKNHAKRAMERRAQVLAFCFAFGVALVFMVRAAMGAVKSVSPDGEATVYSMGEFSAAFDVAYRAVLRPSARNNSWSTLSILLVGSQIPGPGASVGVASAPPHHRPLRPFTYVVYPGLKDDYESYSTSCVTGCVIELRGDARSIGAYVNGKRLASWSRSDLYIQHPHIQLNAEVHGPGDSIYALLIPVRTTAAGRRLPDPTCAFTTRGIEPTGRATLTFHGKTGDAGGSFVNLSTGVRGDKC